MTQPRLLLGRILLAGGSVCVGLLLGPLAPAAAADCTATSGVRVVVDPGGRARTGCAPGDPGSGREALESAGFTVTEVGRQRGFICTIDNVPKPCNDAPADAYWSYWYAPAGGSWTYSSRGSSNRDPAPGTVEGWAFGAGTPPSMGPPRADAERTTPAAPPAPPAPPAPSPAAPPPPAPGSGSAGSPRSGSAAPAPGRPAPVAAATTSSSTEVTPTTDTPTANEATATPTAAAPRTETPATATPTATAATDAATSSEPTELRSEATGRASPVDSGSPTATVVGLLLVVVTAVAAGVLGWRRRAGAGR